MALGGRTKTGGLRERLTATYWSMATSKLKGRNLKAAAFNDAQAVTGAQTGVVVMNPADTGIESRPTKQQSGIATKMVRNVGKRKG